MKLQKSRVTPIDLKIIHKIYTSLKQTYPDNSNRRNYFLAACSLFFVTSDNLNYDILIKLRPYGGLIGIDNSSLDKYLNFTIARYSKIPKFYDCTLFCTMRPDLYTNFINRVPRTVTCCPGTVTTAYWDI